MFAVCYLSIISNGNPTNRLKNVPVSRSSFSVIVLSLSSARFPVQLYLSLLLVLSVAPSESTIQPLLQQTSFFSERIDGSFLLWWMWGNSQKESSWSPCHKV